MRAWIGSGALALAVFAAAPAPASANANASATVQWYAQAIVQMTLTPNYASGYGSVKATFGTQPAAVAGPGACLQGCAVDFGSVMAGDSYLYKYATHLNVVTNDPNGFKLYGEGAADFTNTSDGSSTLLNQTLYYLPSAASNDTNTGFSAALPFYRTAGAVSGNSFATAPTIAYATFPGPMTTVSSSSSDLYYDYQLKVPSQATGGQYYVWIVYTVVPQ